jgi:putative ABC transport system permease protein
MFSIFNSITDYGKPYEISWTLFPDTVLLTVVFFVASFFVVGIFNTRTIQKTKIIDMLSAEKENEPELKKSRFISVVVVLFEVFTVWESTLATNLVFSRVCEEFDNQI